MTYTASEMRHEAEWIAHTGNDLWAKHHITHDEAVRIGEIADALRQAADAMEGKRPITWRDLPVEGCHCSSCQARRVNQRSAMQDKG